MRLLLTLVLLSAVPGVLAHAQEGANQEPDTAAQAAHAARTAATDAELQAEWKKLQDHWAMVESMSGADKTEHLEMHRSMTADFMGRLEGDAEGAGELREGQGPTVGDRLENADREPVEGERPAETDDEAAAAAEATPPTERIDEERTARAEEHAVHGAGDAKYADLHAHWAKVEGIQDPAQLEQHLQMHMDMLEQALQGAGEEPRLGVGRHQHGDGRTHGDRTTPRHQG